MISAINDNNGKMVTVDAVWVARYTNKDVKLSADLGDATHCTNKIYLDKDGFLHISKDNNGMCGKYDYSQDGLILSSWEIEEGHCYVERVELNETNFEFVMKVLKVEVQNG